MRKSRCCPWAALSSNGKYLPLATDTIVACTIARTLADAYPLFTLPPITLSCSHEHAAWPGTVSVSAATMIAIVADVRTSLSRTCIDHLVLINGHGGNYVLGNVVQGIGTAPGAMPDAPPTATTTCTPVSSKPRCFFTPARKFSEPDTRTRITMPRTGPASSRWVCAPIPNPVSSAARHSERQRKGRPSLIASFWHSPMSLASFSRIDRANI
jgi:hypothetical protein